MEPTPLDLARLLVECKQGHRSHGPRLMKYLDTLWLRERIVTIQDGEELLGWCAFFLCEPEDVTPMNNNRFYPRDAWTVPKDRDTGSVAYVDYLVARTWTPGLRKELTTAIVLRHPSVTEARWHQERSKEVVCHG